MDGIILERSEFLVLMDVLEISSIIGISSNEILSSSIKENKLLIEHGIQLLQQRDLLTVNEDNINVLDPTLLVMAVVVAFPQIAFVTVREIPGVGKQLFLHYQSDSFVVEQTFPEEGKHRLATLPTLQALFDRLEQIMPITNASEVGISVTMPQQEFLDMKNLAEHHQHDQATNILRQHGLDEPGIMLLLEAIKSPRFSSNIAIVRCNQQVVIDARNPVLLQGPQSAWVITQLPPTEPIFKVESIDSSIFRSYLEVWHNELL